MKFTVKPNAIEKFDHPFTRQTLYFHELKDLEKYVEIEERKGFPSTQLLNQSSGRIWN